MVSERSHDTELDAVMEREAGVVFAPRDEFANVIRTLAKDEGRLRALGEKGRQFVLDSAAHVSDPNGTSCGALKEMCQKDAPNNELM